MNDNESIRVSFQGKSKSRDPAEFLNPIFQEVCIKAQEDKKNIVLDFCNMIFMNSSSVAPIIKYWATLKNLGIGLTLEYDGNLPWQKNNFSSFTIFEKGSSLFKLKPR